MTMPFYVAPEQVMKDRADYARKGIARGRAMVAVRYADGIALVAENPSNTLRKISEIYDRIAFAGVGKYNEFDQLRVAGVRAADLKGFQYSRDDVDARSLANQYAQILGQVFTHEMKPMEVEILVAEVGYGADDYQLFHILYDGTVMDERRFSVLGGDAEAIAGRLNESYADDAQPGRGASRPAPLRCSGADRTLGADDLEVAVLSRSNGRRCFRRLTDAEVAEILGELERSDGQDRRSQQRCRRGLRGVARRSRPRADADHHVGQRRLRVPRRRPVDHAPHVRDGRREQRRDRRAGQLSRPRRLRPPVHRHEAGRARRRGRLPARRARRRCARAAGSSVQLREAARRAVQHHRPPRGSRPRPSPARSSATTRRCRCSACRAPTARSSARRPSTACVPVRGLRRPWLHSRRHADPAQPAGRAADRRGRCVEAGRRRRRPRHRVDLHPQRHARRCRHSARPSPSACCRRATIAALHHDEGAALRARRDPRRVRLDRRGDGSRRCAATAGSRRDRRRHTGGADRAGHVPPASTGRRSNRCWCRGASASTPARDRSSRFPWSTTASISTTSPRRRACSIEQVIETHSSVVYSAAFLGFTPGGHTSSGLPTELHLPRRSTPRTAITAGSVAIANEFTGVYPTVSPGGWHLLGHTTATMFDVDRDKPALVMAGDRVRFVRA